MSGRGKGGKGLGKGGAKRHRKVLRNEIQGVTKPAIRRLARRGGVKRISGHIYEETRGVLKVFMKDVLRDVTTYTAHARRKTVTAMDVVHALKRQGRTLYGFGGGVSSGSAAASGRRRRASKKFSSAVLEANSAALRGIKKKVAGLCGEGRALPANWFQLWIDELADAKQSEGHHHHDPVVIHVQKGDETFGAAVLYTKIDTTNGDNVIKQFLDGETMDNFYKVFRGAPETKKPDIKAIILITEGRELISLGNEKMMVLMGVCGKSGGGKEAVQNAIKYARDNGAKAIVCFPDQATYENDDRTQGVIKYNEKENGWSKRKVQGARNFIANGGLKKFYSELGFLPVVRMSYKNTSSVYDGKPDDATDNVGRFNACMVRFMP